jgi:flagellar motor switch protein FliG
MSDDKLTASDRAAVLLLLLGEQEAASVLQYLGPKEVQKVGIAMTTLGKISRKQVSMTLEEFVRTVEDQSALGIGAEEYVRSIFASALGEEKAGTLIDRVLFGHNAKGLEALKWMDARAVADIIGREHPQIIAVVLSILDADHAAGVLALLPPRERPDVLMRIARLDGIQPYALQELDEVIKRQFSGNANLKSSEVGGVKQAAEILNFVDGAIEAEVLESIKESDAELGQAIQDKTFVFDDLVDLDDRGMQSLLRELASETLILALKGADDEVRTKVYRNLSKRASEILRDDLEAKGPVPLSDVEAAQKEILAIARRMAEAGELAVGAKGAERYV